MNNHRYHPVDSILAFDTQYISIGLFALAFHQPQPLLPCARILRATFPHHPVKKNHKTKKERQRENG